MAQDFADTTLRDELFAGPPHVTSVNCLLPRVGTRRHWQPTQGKVLVLPDVQSACLHWDLPTQRVHQAPAQALARRAR